MEPLTRNNADRVLGVTIFRVEESERHGAFFHNPTPRPGEIKTRIDEK